MSLSYKDAGVDIAAADDFVRRIGGLAAATHNNRVVPAVSAFAGLVRPNLDGMNNPLLAAACDGVGTKLLVALRAGRLQGLGQDLVAMSVNDLLPVGARPLLFLDYIATGKLDPAQLVTIVGGIASACKAVDCVLLGGETAEMPGLYAPGDFDLAGFAVGLVDAARVPDPNTIATGDVVLALPSSGVHANGFSLIRSAVLDRAGMALDENPEGFDHSLGDELLRPTRLYVNEVAAVQDAHTVKAGAHVTGGGLLGRAGKIAPSHRVVIDPRSYERPPIFDIVQRCGDVSTVEMAKTFNMGLGYLLIVDAKDADAIIKDKDAASDWLRVGEITTGTGVDLGYAAA